MDIFKSVVDCAFVLFGLIIGAAAIHKGLEEKLKKVVMWLDRHPWWKKAIGAFVMLLCFAYIGAAVFIPIQQKQEQKTERASQSNQISILQHQVSNESSQVGNLQKQVAEGRDENKRIIFAMATNSHPILAALSIMSESSPPVQIDNPQQIDPDIARSEFQRRHEQQLAQDAQAKLEEESNKAQLKQRILEKTIIATSNCSPAFDYARPTPPRRSYSCSTFMA